MLKKEEFTKTRPEDTFNETLKELDERRVEYLENLLVLRQSKTTLLEREIERLKSKYDEHHPRIIETRRKNEFNNIYVKEIENEIVYARTPTPTPDRQFWIVYGYVRDDKNNFVDGAEVKLFDQTNQVGSHTDKSRQGLFELKIGNISSLPVALRVGISPTQLGAKELKPELGRVDYAEIIISASRPVVTEKPLVLPSTLDFTGWIVMGKVVDARGNAVADLTVEVYDKDLIHDDLLYETTTNEEGIYRATFSMEQFSDLGLEEYPELYLIIKDAAGDTLFDGKQEARSSAGRIELMDVKLEKTFDEDEKNKGEK